MTKPHKKSTRKISRKKRTTLRNLPAKLLRRVSRGTANVSRFAYKVLPVKRSLKMLRLRGGNSSAVSFPPSFSNTDVAASPQSYLPYNNFANDPGYSVVNASNAGPFLTGVSSGGSKKHKKNKNKPKNRKVRVIYGGDTIHANISNGINTVTNGSGIVVAPALNELTGIAGVMSGFSNTGSAYTSTPVTMVPLA